MAHRKLHSADVVAAFESQDEADEAVLQLRMAGIGDSRIGYFVWHPVGGLTDLMDRNFAFAGSVIGGIIGAALGAWLARLLNDWSVLARDLTDPLGLAITCGTFGALFVGLLGWGIGVGMRRTSVAAPAVDSRAGAFILAVSAGDTRDRVWSIIHGKGGHELPPGALMTGTAAV